MDWLAALLGAGGSLVSGWLGANAANGATASQIAALENAIRFQTGNVDRAARANEGATERILGVTGAANERALGRMNMAITNSIKRANSARDASISGQDKATAGAVATQSGFYDRARTDMAPWMQAGQKALEQYSGELGLGGPDGQPFQSQFRTTPGYEFQVQEGEKGAVNNLRALGMGGSGAALKALTAFRTGLADQTYSKYLADLKGVADSGQSAATNLGQLGAQTGANIGQTLMTGAGANTTTRMGTAELSNNAAIQGAGKIGDWLTTNAGNAASAIGNGASNLGNILVNGGGAIASNIANIGTVQGAGTVGGTNAWINALGNFTNNMGRALGGFGSSGGMGSYTHFTGGVR